MKKTYITHVTRDYLEVALNLAKSVSLFSDLPLIVYCINLQEEDKQKFDELKDQKNTYGRQKEIALYEYNRRKDQLFIMKVIGIVLLICLVLTMLINTILLSTLWTIN